MKRCRRCGYELADGQRFCGTCGLPVDAPAALQTDPPTRSQTGPQAAPPQAYAAGATQQLPGPGDDPDPPSTAAGRGLDPSVLRPLLVGDWLGAVKVALAIGVTAGVVSLAIALLGKPDGFGERNTLTAVASLMAAAFGADVVFTADDPDGTFDVVLSAVPLTITLLALAAGVLLFRRVVPARTPPVTAIGAALRVAVLVAVGILAIALVFRSGGDDYTGGLIADASTDEADWGPSRLGAVVGSLLVVAVVLSATALLRAEPVPERARRVRALVRAPLAGVGVMLVLLPVVGLVGAAFAWAINGSEPVDEATTDEVLTTVAAGAALLVNGGFAWVALGAGAPLVASGESGTGFGSGQASESARLAYVTGEGDVAGLWVCVVLMPLWLLAGAYVVVRRSSSRDRVLGDLVRWVGLLVVTLPLLGLASRLSGSYELEYTGGEEIGAFTGSVEASGTAGVDVLQTTLFVLGFAIVAAAVVALVTGSVDRDRLRSALRPSTTGGDGPPPTYGPPAGNAPPPPGPPLGPPPGPPPR